MCGIAGILNFSEQKIETERVVKNMIEKISHRGKDGEGTETFENQRFTLSLAHKRLAIIDLSDAAKQPFFSKNKNICLTYNGEIYNYVELRENLQHLNNQFFTNSDTEVLIAAYQHFGIECLQHFNGMFAFVLYDKKRNLLFGARDRTGVKPFYYFFDKKIFAFASEQKALFQKEFYSPQINEKQLFNYLILNHSEQESEGFFSNIFELLPSHFFILDLNTFDFKIQRYFSLSFEEKIGNFDEKISQNHIENIRNLIFEAIKIRLRSDVPVGFALSGGIDSTSIVCVAQKIVNFQEQICFTAVNESESTNEEKWANIVAKHCNIKLIRVDCTAEKFFSNWENLVFSQNIPLLGTSTFAQSQVMKAANEYGITVLLDGQGSDEIFAGYEVFYPSFYLEMLRNLKLLHFFDEMRNIKNSPVSFSIFLKSLIKLSLDVFPSQIFSFLKPEMKLLSQNFYEKNIKNVKFSSDFSAKPMNEMLKNHLTNYFLRKLLRAEDRCSMQYSVESRTPFADDLPLINYVFSIPATYKIRKGFSKFLLREAMKNIIPKEIYLRTDKLGFATPQDLWLKKLNTKLREKFLQYNDYQEFIDKKKILSHWDKIFAEKNVKLRNFVFRVLNFLMWKKMFF